MEPPEAIYRGLGPLDASGGFLCFPYRGRKGCATSTYRFSGVWLDIGAQTTMRYVDTSDDTGHLVAVALEEYSNAALFQYWDGQLFTASMPSTSSLAYNQTQTVARLVFTTGTEDVSVVLPAPLLSIFMSDGRTVDPTSIPDIISAVVGHVVSNAGNLVTAFVTGYLDGARSVP